MNSTFRAATVAAFVACSTARAFALPNPSEVIQARDGPIKITPIYHASLQIEYHGKVIQVDPFSAGDYTGAKKADLILITHSHPDHYDAKAIRSLLKPNAAIKAPLAVAEQLNNDHVAYNGVGLNNGQSTFVGDVEVQSVPAYNIKRGPKPGQKFHPKGQFNGYILTMGGKRIYIAGDTEATPEMKALKNIDIAFLPMNLPYTMTPQEAAQGAKAFRPKVVYPYHYRFPFDKPNDNPQQFQKLLAGSGIEVRIRGWYAHPAGK
jgi:L-ascorbate metabolism protein UlaG (beta-lactamase superfamily)